MPKGMTRWLLLTFLVAAYVVLISNSSWWQAVFHFLFPSESVVLHPGAPLVALVWQHIQLVGLSSAFTIVLGVALGIWVTRESGADFLPVVNSVASLSQTFPPIAVLALAVPVLGFGTVPTVVALILYGMLPIIRNTIAGIRSIDTTAVDAAYGIGMSRWQTLLRVEVPLALPVILVGIRISVVINVGTAMIGAVIGAGGLGSPIVAGLVRDNLAFILEGAIPGALLAILIDRLLANLETSLTPYRK